MKGGRRGGSLPRYTPEEAKARRNDYIRRYRLANPEKRRQWELKYRTNSNPFAIYGLTREMHKDLLVLQQDRCAICTEFFGSSRNTHVDHDHITGKVRGLLCANCNHGLGKFKDSIILLEAAIEYLKGK